MACPESDIPDTPSLPDRSGALDKSKITIVADVPTIRTPTLYLPVKIVSDTASDDLLPIPDQRDYFQGNGSFKKPSRRPKPVSLPVAKPPSTGNDIHGNQHRDYFQVNGNYGYNGNRAPDYFWFVVLMGILALVLIGIVIILV